MRLNTSEAGHLNTERACGRLEGSANRLTHSCSRSPGRRRRQLLHPGNCDKLLGSCPPPPAISFTPRPPPPPPPPHIPPTLPSSSSFIRVFNPVFVSLARSSLSPSFSLPSLRRPVPHSSHPPPLLCSLPPLLLQFPLHLEHGEVEEVVRVLGVRASSKLEEVKSLLLLAGRVEEQSELGVGAGVMKFS
eukprot:28359-Hanusia_phi.AAC.6